MLVRSAQRKSISKLFCEDSYTLSPSTLTWGVFDGVTPIVPYRNKQGENGAQIASHLFALHFQQTQITSSLYEELQQANKKMHAKMKEHHIPTHIPHHRWATCAAVARIHNNMFSYAQIGDCMIAVKTRQGGWKALTYNSVEGIGSRMKERRMTETKATEADCDFFFSSFENYVTYMREMANAPNGYTVADGEDISQSIQTGEISLTDITAALLCTDGIFSSRSPLLSSCRSIEEQGLELFLHALEYDEVTYNLPSDDKTAILFEF